MAKLTEKVTYLEKMLERIAYNDQALQMKLDRLADEMKAFKDEMKAFKDEMRAFKDEMRVFKDEMKVFKDEMKVFKDEMGAFKDEMKTFKDEMLEFKEWSKKNIENMNKQWGHLANKLGTLVEDIFAPSIDIAIEKYFGCKPNIKLENYRETQDGDHFEIDILAICNKKGKAFIVEVKANPDRIEYINSFEEKMKKIREKLEMVKGYELYPIYAVLNMEESTIKTLTKKGIYAMIVRGDMLEVVNIENVRKN